MSIYSVVRVLVLLLVLLPLVSAAVVPLLGRAARRVSLTVALLHLGVAAGVVLAAVQSLGYRDDSEGERVGRLWVQRFQPEFVPGDSGGRSDISENRTAWTLFSLSASPTPPGKPGPDVQLFLGIDGLNLWLVALASFMLVPVILVSWDAIREKPGAFYGWLFLLQAGVVGAFLSFDVILFYVFFELTLIPTFFLIGRWGSGSGRRDAARKFFLYTLAGSLLTLLGVVGVVLTNPTPVHPDTGTRVPSAVVEALVPDASQPQGTRVELVPAKAGPVTFSLPDLMGNVQVWADARARARAEVADSEANLGATRAAGAAPDAVRAAEQRLAAATQVQAEVERSRAGALDVQFWLFVALMAGFMVKVPVWPFHTWLPSAYSEAPTGVTMLLSALLAKLGTFGILRLVLPLVPDAALAYGLPAVGWLAAFGIVYAALCAYAAKDMKLVVAYSSVSHLGFLVLGLFAFNAEGVSGAVLHMVNHGLSTGALFAALGFLLERYRTTEIARFGGLMGRFPGYAVLVFVLALASIGLPGLNNFVSEMMMLAGLYDARNPGAPGLGLAVVAAVGIFLSAWYTLTVLRRVFFNPLREPEAAPDVPGVSRREFVALGSLAALCLLLGLFPQTLVEPMRADVRVLSNIGDAARARAGVPYADEDAPPPQADAPGAAPPGPPGPVDKGGKKGGKGPAPKGGFPKGGKGNPKITE